MRLENNGGDKLASGATRAQFYGPNVTQAKWDKIFDDYNPEEHSRNAGVKETGDGSTSIGEDWVCPI